MMLSYPLGILRSVAFARMATPEVYGQYNYVLSIIGMVGILSLPGLNTALVESVARGHGDSVFVAARTRIRWGLLSALACSGVAIYQAVVEQNITVAIAIFAGGLLIPPTVSSSTALQYYNGRKRFDLISRINVGILLTKTLILLLLLWYQKNVVWLIVGDSLVNIAFYGFAFRTIPERTGESKPDAGLVSYGRSLTWANAITVIAGHLDNVLLAGFYGFADVAVYRVASTLPESTKSMTKLIPTLVMPKIAERPDKRVYSATTRRQLYWLQMANFLAVLVIVAILPFLMQIFGDQYVEATRIAQVLMLTLSFNWVNSVLIGAFQARKQTATIYRSNLLMGGFQLVTLIITVPFWGIWGVVASRAAARLSMTIYYWKKYREI